MKKGLILLGLCLSANVLFGQEITGQASYDKFWSEVDMDYKDEVKSPLSPEDRLAFDSIARFAYNEKYRVKAKWNDLKRQKPIKFMTSSGELKSYQKVALLEFVIDGDTLELSAYQNLRLMRNPEYASYIFVPFTDESNGLISYGGGRYLDLSKPEEETFILDFNQAYNPYCAYSDGYSCPIPPKENNLIIEILAGAKSEK